MVEVVMNFVRATMEDNWALLLECIKKTPMTHKLCPIFASVLHAHDLEIYFLESWNIYRRQFVPLSFPLNPC